MTLQDMAMIKYLLVGNSSSGGSQSSQQYAVMTSSYWEKKRYACVHTLHFVLCHHDDEPSRYVNALKASQQCTYIKWQVLLSGATLSSQSLLK